MSLTVAVVGAIISKRALTAADLGLVSLTDCEFERAIDALSSHSSRVGLTQELFVNGENAGRIALVFWWSSIGAAIREQARTGLRRRIADTGAAQDLSGHVPWCLTSVAGQRLGSRLASFLLQ